VSRAGAAASRERRRLEKEARDLEAFFAKLEQDALADLMLAACEACGLVQVQPPSPWYTAVELCPPAGTVCVSCGNGTARFVTSDLAEP
jgi:hypothetical protein